MFRIQKKLSKNKSLIIANDCDNIFGGKLSLFTLKIKATTISIRFV